VAAPSPQRELGDQYTPPKGTIRMSSLVRTITMLAAVYVCYAAIVYVRQRAIIYPGRTIRVPAIPPVQVVPLWVKTATGRSEAWFLPTPGSGRRPVVIVFHGNGEVIDFLPEQMEGFRRLGMHVLLVEYPGFGRSEGSPSEESITAAALASYDVVVRRDDVDGRHVVAFGRSLGCAAACALAARRPVVALILQSPFTSTRPFARRMLLPPFLARDVFDNRAVLAAYDGPVLIFHGRFDGIIPFAHGRELAAVARHGRLVELSCGHNDCPPDWAEFWRVVGDFLKTELR
ncbi:MAG TPA: alpha/beta hydrolase, partial [Geobacteraceae bacterium]